MIVCFSLVEFGEFVVESGECLGNVFCFKRVVFECEYTAGIVGDDFGDVEFFKDGEVVLFKEFEVVGEAGCFAGASTAFELVCCDIFYAEVG